MSEVLSIRVRCYEKLKALGKVRELLGHGEVEGGTAASFIGSDRDQLCAG